MELNFLLLTDITLHQYNAETTVECVYFTMMILCDCFICIWL